ncbi:ubiquitin-like domain-containing protein [Cutibacterium granulosum]|uniref:ubiquitin-like domain-containing protein n=1 Tax=Cutibacterium granulosum TaxID=33011 RepID=UPI0023F924AE|nr:ubiquitin-like domain-containing protein [Cutibacterium granulosum]
MSKIIASAIAGAVALTTAGGVTMANVLNRDDVTISVDGVSREAKVHPGTVQEVLGSQGITVGEHDSVQPALNSDVSDGSVITVKYGRKVVLTVDGKKVTRWTTETNVSDFLAKAGLVDSNDNLSVSRSSGISRQGLSINVDTAQDVIVKTGSKSQQVSARGTVADALKAADIKVDSNDISKPGLGTPLTYGMVIDFTKVDTKKETRKSDAKFKTKTVKDSSMDKGTTKITTKGVNGVNEETWEITYKNGKKAGERKISSKAVKPATDEVKKVGTKSTSKPSPAKKSAASKSASASTVSNGGGSNSNPVTGGTTCQASTYGAGDGTAGGPTASGETFDPSKLTAASRTLPLGSTIRVTNVSNGKTVSVRINDRGPYVGGRCLDLSTAAMNAIAPGAGLVTVRYQ